MTLGQIFAIIYTALVALPASMHIALATGAPLGKFTIGGRFKGRLPPLWRGLALVQLIVLVVMAFIVLARAGLHPVTLPIWVFWCVVALTFLTLIANAFSPSRPERLLWTPVTACMLGAAVVVALN